MKISPNMQMLDFMTKFGLFTVYPKIWSKKKYFIKIKRVSCKSLSKNCLCKICMKKLWDPFYRTRLDRARIPITPNEIFLRCKYWLKRIYNHKLKKKNVTTAFWDKCNWSFETVNSTFYAKLQFLKNLKPYTQN